MIIHDSIFQTGHWMLILNPWCKPDGNFCQASQYSIYWNRAAIVLVSQTFLLSVQCDVLIYVHCEMITTIKFINIYPSSHIITFLMVRTVKIYSLSKFLVHNTVLLAVVTILYIRSSELSHITESLCALTSISPLLPAPSNHYSTLCMSLTFFFPHK